MRGSAQGGFTLIEILLVVIIIAILASLVVANLTGRTEQARKSAAKFQIENNFSTALDLYEADNGQYPSTEQGLQALREQPTSEPVPQNWKGPYLKKDVPMDPWGNPYQYTHPGVKNPGSYDLYSYGPDRKEGGEDDICNWK
jgi:general secretion pathway protein G